MLAAACSALNDVVCAGSAFDRAALVAPLAAVLRTHAAAHPAVAATSAAALSALLWQAPRLERRALNDAATAAGAPGAAAAALTAFGVADADVALGAASLLANMCVSHELGTGAGDAAVTAGALEAVTAALAANACNQAAAPLICALANLLPAACNAALRARACAAGAAAAVAAVAAAQPLMPGLDWKAHKAGCQAEGTVRLACRRAHAAADILRCCMPMSGADTTLWRGVSVAAAARLQLR